MNTTFKYGTRVIPMQRAIAMGLADANGNAVGEPLDSRALKLIQKEARKAEFAKMQADKPKRRASAVVFTEVTEPETLPDGRIKGQRKRGGPKVEPLRPQNVTPEGDPITDEETLAEIAAKTALIEASASPLDAIEEAVDAAESVTNGPDDPNPVEDEEGEPSA